jgi:hypothetical protein
MRVLNRITTALAAATALLAATAVPALASAPGHGQDRAPFGGARHVVFVQTDNTAGNDVVAYDRAQDGTLSPAGSYPTGGLGGVLAGSVVDHLASQGSLAYDPAHASLIAVNAGSDTVSVFRAHGDRLHLRPPAAPLRSLQLGLARNGSLNACRASPARRLATAGRWDQRTAR